jgi:type 1 glutamine amidotransferase
MASDIIILSGEGPHADPWHPLSETSARLADVVYDALGHDVRSFEAPEHVELLKRTVSWLRDRS